MEEIRNQYVPGAGQPVVIGPPPPLPIIVFTRNGAVIGVAIGPPGANDVRIFFGGLGGFGWWTQNRVFVPNGGFVIPFGANDIHFSANGQIIPRPGVHPPPGANDIELFWDKEGNIEGWWTRDGSYLEPVRSDGDRREFHCTLVLHSGLAAAEPSLPKSEATVSVADLYHSYHRRLARIFDLMQPYVCLVQEDQKVFVRIHACRVTELSLTESELRLVAQALRPVNEGIRHGYFEVIPGSVSLRVHDTEKGLATLVPFMSPGLKLKIGDMVARTGWTWFPPEFEIELTQLGTTALIDALAAGSGAAWLSAELGLGTPIAGVVAAILALQVGVLGLLRDLSSKGAITLSITWNPLVPGVPLVFPKPA
jgi:hypothetical protein